MGKTEWKLGVGVGEERTRFDAQVESSVEDRGGVYVGFASFSRHCEKCVERSR